MSAKEQLRIAAWKVRERLRRAMRASLPEAATWSRVTMLDAVHEAWPARVIHPDPFVYHPVDDEERRFFDSVGRVKTFVGRPIILPPVQVHALPDAMMWVSSGLIADARGRIVLESVKGSAMLEPYREFRGLKRVVRRSDESRSVSTILLGHQSLNWYHFVIDSLPRLYALGKLDEEIALAVPSDLAGPRRALLERALPRNVRLVEHPPGTLLRFRKVLLSPCVTLGGCGLIRPEIAADLRGRIRGNGRPDRRRRRIYASRAGATSRRVVNEPEVVAALARHRVEAIEAGKLGFDEQLELFASAELVIGLHGANLTNCLFSERAALIEIVPVNLCYWGVARSADGNYVGLQQEGSRAGAAAGEDVIVDVGALADAIDRALAGARR